MKDYIRIKRDGDSERNVLSFKLSLSKNMERYFTSKKLFVEYDVAVDTVDESILQIPAIAGVITIAWAKGADVYAEELDEKYLSSLKKISSIMEKWHPYFSWSSDIPVGKIVSNKFENTRYGLLFSSGVDSTTTYIRQRGKKPDLIHVLETDSQRALKKVETEKIKRKLVEFAKHEEVGIHFIRTNIPPGIKPESILYEEFGLPWWTYVCYGIILTGLCAPLMVVNNIGSLFMASSWIPGIKFTDSPGYGDHPYIMNNLSWANIKIHYDGYELGRQQKLKIIKEYVNETGYYPNLRVCFLPQVDNCGKCEKCLKNICGMVLTGLDPNRLGFTNVNNKIFDLMKHSIVKAFQRKHLIEKKATLIGNYGNLFLFQDIQQNIPEKTNHLLYNSGWFFKWLADINLLKLYNRSRDIRFYQLPKLAFFHLYNKLPRRLKTTLKNILKPIRKTTIK